MDSKRNQRMCLTLVLILLIGTGGKANADFVFGTPTNLGSLVNSSSLDVLPNLSADGLTLYFESNRSGGYGKHDLWMTTKQTNERNPEVYWDTPINLGPTINSSSEESAPSISADGLELYFSSFRSGGQGGWDLWVARRETISSSWSAPVNLGPPVNSSSAEWSPCISADGLELYLWSDRASTRGRDELWIATRNTTDDDWGAPVNLGPTVNSRSLDATPSISSDGLMLFFQSNRPGGYGGIVDIWATQRVTTDSDWNTPFNLGPVVNTSGWDGNPCISADGSTIYFVSNRSGGSGKNDLWQVSIDPVVDLNGDGIVDALDMCIIVNHWGTDEPLYDIGPMPWGDGIVDVQDLIVLAEHLFEEFPPVQ